MPVVFAVSAESAAQHETHKLQHEMKFSLRVEGQICLLWTGVFDFCCYRRGAESTELANAFCGKPI